MFGRVAVPGTIAQSYFGRACTEFGLGATVTITVTDPPNAPGTVTGSFTYQYPGSKTVSTVTMSGSGPLSGSFPSPDWGSSPTNGGAIPIVITIRDAAGNTTVANRTIKLDSCVVIG